MARPAWVDSSAPAVTAANLNAMTAADATEAATNAALGGSATIDDNMNRIRAAISQIVAGNFTTGMTAVLAAVKQCVQLSPGGQQTGNINISGLLSAGGVAVSGNETVGGALTVTGVATVGTPFVDTTHGTGGTIAAGSAQSGTVSVSNGCANGTGWTISTTAAVTGRTVQLTGVCGVPWHALFQCSAVPNGSNFGVVLDLPSLSVVGTAGSFNWTII